jgi:glycosyltransferase involved in cell wall biosynthesis
VPPLVSIVTPSLNQGRFLRRTIESVVRQDYPHIEYLVIDGGSTDESLAILHSYGERVAWISEPDRGQSDAINKGLARTRGTICAYLNSDDVLLPGAIASVVRHFERQPDWDLVYGKAQHIDADDCVLAAYPTAVYSFARLLQDCCICQPATFWRRPIGARIGPLDENLHFAMDYDYWMRIDRAGGRLVHVPEILACSRLYPETKTLSRRLEVYREILQTCVKHAGAASFSQCLAYWHHRCHERGDGWPRRLRYVPNCAWWLALLHTRWQRQRGAALPFCLDLLRSSTRRLARASARSIPALAAEPRSCHRAAPRAPSQESV